ncbi:MAG: cytidylate kinase family protein, partial [Niameybacter sp.]
MKNFVMTIARGYGSGGRTIGKMLAADLNIPYYDRNLLRLASDDSGINEQLFID